MKIKSGLIFLSSIFLALTLVIVACSDDDDVGEITKDMRNRLADALGFDNADLEEGEPPEEHDGESDYPQITSIEFPDQLYPGLDFEIKITTDFTNTEDIKGAVVYVEDADNYLVVEESVQARDSLFKKFKLIATGDLPGGGAEMVLSGELDRDSDDLLDFEYDLQIALMNSDEEVGNYHDWEVELVEKDDYDDDDSDSDSHYDGDYNDYDGDYNGYDSYACRSDRFDCSDSQAQMTYQALSNTSQCQAVCNPGEVTEENAEEYQNCVYCCYQDNMIPVGEDSYVECVACWDFVADSEHEDPEADENIARQNASDSWSSITVNASECVR